MPQPMWRPNISLLGSVQVLRKHVFPDFGPVNVHYDSQTEQSGRCTSLIDLGPIRN